jgi:hypothetical protein
MSVEPFARTIQLVLAPLVVVCAKDSDTLVTPDRARPLPRLLLLQAV